MKNYTVIDGKLCIEDNGVKAWFTRTLIEKWIAKLEVDLSEWKGRLALLDANKDVSK